MDTPVSELSTLNEIIFGLVAGVSIIAIMYGFPVLAEKTADVICALTQKVVKQFLKMLIWTTTMLSFGRSEHHGI